MSAKEPLLEKKQDMDNKLNSTHKHSKLDAHLETMDDDDSLKGTP